MGCVGRVSLDVLGMEAYEFQFYLRSGVMPVSMGVTTPAKLSSCHKSSSASSRCVLTCAEAGMGRWHTTFAGQGLLGDLFSLGS